MDAAGRRGQGRGTSPTCWGADRAAAWKGRRTWPYSATRRTGPTPVLMARVEERHTANVCILWRPVDWAAVRPVSTGGFKSIRPGRIGILKLLGVETGCVAALGGRWGCRFEIRGGAVCVQGNVRRDSQDERKCRSHTRPAGTARGGPRGTRGPPGDGPEGRTDEVGSQMKRDCDETAQPAGESRHDQTLTTVDERGVDVPGPQGRPAAVLAERGDRRGTARRAVQTRRAV